MIKKNNNSKRRKPPRILEEQRNESPQDQNSGMDEKQSEEAEGIEDVAVPTSDEVFEFETTFDEHDSGLSEEATFGGLEDEPTQGILYGGDPEPSKSEESFNQEEVSWKYYDDSSYFMIFGVRSSGKTVALSGLMYFLQTTATGSVQILNDNEILAERKGSMLFDQLLSHVPVGRWFTGSPQLRADGIDVPRQIHLEFRPANEALPEFRFCTMDLSGEDLKNVRLSHDQPQATLHPGIREIFNLPSDHLTFVCVYPAEDTVYSNEERSAYMRSFFEVIDRTDNRAIPLILLISKWDLVSENYSSAQDFMEREDPIIWSKLSDVDRDVTLMTYSIGQGDASKFQYDPKDSEKLFRWMYRSCHNQDYDSPTKQSFWTRMLSLFFNQ